MSLGGGCYGAAGVFIGAAERLGDPLVGNPMLLQIFAAVVVGGTVLGGGRGGPVGSIFGAYILMMVVNILLVLNVSAYYSDASPKASILILAVLGGSISRNSTLARQIRSGIIWLGAWRAGTLPRQVGRPAARLRFAYGRPSDGARRRSCPASSCATPRRCATRCRPMSAS